MTPVIEQARARVIDQRRWGTHPENAIRTGQWDAGSLIRHAVIEIEAELIRDRKEQEHG